MIAPQAALREAVTAWPLPPPRVVALGGGTGLPVLLQGLKGSLFPKEWRETPLRGRDQLCAIVTVADDGGSSGRLRKSYRVLPPGDIRNCLLALAEADPSITGLFDYRFNGEGEMAGHSLGNLILTALSRLEIPFTRAVERAGDLLATRGRVFPATLEEVTLCAEFFDGTSATGESRIAACGRRIERVSLDPPDVRGVPQALGAIHNADLVLLGPGSLYTSLLPVLLVSDVAEALARTRARIALVMNLMTEPGETDGYTASDHLRAIKKHAPRVPIHDVIINADPIPAEWVEAYAECGARPIVVDDEALKALGSRPVWKGVVGGGPKIRHDSERLAKAALELACPMPEALAR
jgi:uncharacterized cofD-like protein